MNLSNFLYLIIILNIIIGLFVLFRNMKNKVNISLSFFIFAVSAWVLSSVMAFASSSVIWARLSFTTSLLLLFFCLMFLQFFLINILKKYEKKIVYMLLSIIIIGIGVSASGMLVEEVLSVSSIDKGITLKMGILYPPIIAIYTFAIFYGIYLLVIGYRRSTGIQKLQVRYLLLSIIIFSILAISTNLIFEVDI